jgi:hypothetical protein
MGKGSGADPILSLIPPPRLVGLVTETTTDPPPVGLMQWGDSGD